MASGYVERRGKSWRIVIEAGRKPDGSRNRIFKTMSGVTKKEAEAEMHRIANELTTGVYVEPSKLTLSEYLDQWLENHSKTRLSPMSAFRYKKEIENRIKPVIGHIRLEHLTPLAIQSFVDEIEKAGWLKSDKPLSAEMITYDLKIIKRALKQAVKWGLIPRNPASDIAAPQATKNKEMNILTEEQIKNLLSTLKTGKDFQKYVLILLLVSTGLRLGEALALTWDDIDFEPENEVILVNKTIQRVDGEILIKPPKTESSNRKVTIDPILAAALKRHSTKQKERRLMLGSKWKGKGNHVFTGPTGGLTVNSTIENWWIQFRKQNGLEGIRLHDMRHTHATHLLASGKIDIKTIAQRLGHKNAAMTLNIYSHVLPAKEREAAKVMSYLWQ